MLKFTASREDRSGVGSTDTAISHVEDKDVVKVCEFPFSRAYVFDDGAWQYLLLSTYCRRLSMYFGV